MRADRASASTFSLNFRLMKMTAEACIEFLVTRVGLERENAIGELRRSFARDYGALY